jgi:hypothetical protein
MLTETNRAGSDAGGADAGTDAGGADAGGEDAGGDEADGEDAGGDEAGGEEAGGDEAGGDDAGGEDAGGDEAGGDEAGGDDTDGLDAGGEDAGGLPAPEPPGCVDPGPPGCVDPGPPGCVDPGPPSWAVQELTGTGGTDELDLDRVGVTYASGGIRIPGWTGDDALGLAGGLDAEPGAVATASARACGWTWLPGCDRSAPIKANAATAETATSPPLRYTEATGREMR